VKEWRGFLAALLAVLVAPLPAEAQQTLKPVKIGWIAVTPQDRNRGPEQFRPIVEHHLRQRGWEPHFELRYAAGDQDRLARMAAELVKAQLDVIVAPGTNGAVTTKRATSSIPIVMSSADPLGAGLVASLARPGANVTGVSAFFDDGVAGKWVEFLREVGTVRNIAVVSNATSVVAVERVNAIERAALALGLKTRRLDLRSADDVDTVIQLLNQTIQAGLIYDPDLTLLPYAPRVMEAALRQRVPSVVGFAPQAAVTGALLAYGPSLPEIYRMLAVYVDRILRGAKPGDLPVEQVRKHDLVINLKTAKALDLTIPPSLLLRADQVIE